MELPFVLRGLEGRITVAYEATASPELVGAPPAAAGFPHCHATVDYPGRGYDAVLGWVQLVRSDDNRSLGRDFEIDPLDFLGELPHPFCWIGLNPQLFDAPSRSPLRDMAWMAHSFLCAPDSGEGGRFDVHALAGFSWGFQVRDERITLVPPVALEPADWDGHRDLLSARYASWRFAAGLRHD